MPRKLRLFADGAVYHVYCRASRGEMAFAAAGEAERVIAELQRAKDRDQLTVFAFCVMGNHYHVGLRTAQVPLWKTMLSLQARIAKGYNRSRGVLGPLWQSRYKARMVEDQAYFDQLLAYIHLNPVAAGLVDDPALYRWSGHRELLGLRDRGLVDVDETLASFGPSRETARVEYLERVRVCAQARWASEGLRGLPWWTTVENDEETVAPSYGETYSDYTGTAVEAQRPYVPLATLCQLLCRCLDLEASELAGRSSRRPLAETRAILAALAVEYYGHRATDVAKLLRKHPGSVSRWLARTDSLITRLEKVDEFILNHIDQGHNL